MVSCLMIYNIVYVCLKKLTRIWRSFEGAKSVRLEATSQYTIFWQVWYTTWLVGILPSCLYQGYFISYSIFKIFDFFWGTCFSASFQGRSVGAPIFHYFWFSASKFITMWCVCCWNDVYGCNLGFDGCGRH